MTNETPTLSKYRVLYAVTRAEYYEIEAANESEAEQNAFGDGNLVLVGVTTDVTDCETVEITEFSLPILEEHDAQAVESLADARELRRE